jgi:hypothetical protein
LPARSGKLITLFYYWLRRIIEVEAIERGHDYVHTRYYVALSRMALLSTQALAARAEEQGTVQVERYPHPEAVVEVLRQFGLKEDVVSDLVGFEILGADQEGTVRSMLADESTSTA